MTDKEVESMATRMISNYGEDVVAVLRRRTARLRKAGHLDDAETWKRVAEVAARMLG